MTFTRMHSNYIFLSIFWVNAFRMRHSVSKRFFGMNVSTGGLDFFALDFFAMCWIYLPYVGFICHQNPVWKFIGFFCHPDLDSKFPAKTQKIEVWSIKTSKTAPYFCYLAGEREQRLESTVENRKFCLIWPLVTDQDDISSINLSSWRARISYFCSR